MKNKEVGGDNGVKKGRPSLLIPSDNRFLSNKKISDRVYAWILLNGERVDSDIFIDKTPRNAYKDIGINYRTFYKRLEELVENGYLEDYEYQYKVSKDISEYNRYVYYDIVKRLYELKIDNIIKVYIYLGSMYAQYGNNAWFTYNSILAAIGYSHERNIRNQEKVKIIIEKLAELNLIKYCRTYEEGSKYQIKFKLLNVKGK